MILFVIFFVFVIIVVVGMSDSKKPPVAPKPDGTCFTSRADDDTPTYEDWIKGMKDATEDELKEWLGPPPVFVEQPEMDWDVAASERESVFHSFRRIQTDLGFLLFEDWPESRKISAFWEGDLFARYLSDSKIYECRRVESRRFIWGIIEPRTMVFEHIVRCDLTELPTRFHQIDIGAEGPKEKWRHIIIPAVKRPDFSQNDFQEPVDDLPF